MLQEALIVGFVVALAKFLDWWFSSQLSRPIFIVALLGVLLGHPAEGIILGAQLELIFIGNVSLGGVMPSDITLGSIFGAAFAMILGSDIETAVALAVPISLLGTLLYSGMKIVITSLVPLFEKHISERKIKSFNRLWWLQFAGFHLVYFLLGFIVILLGARPVELFIESIPAWVQSSMTVASTMLPAVGLALLLKMLWNKSLAPYYFLGFGLGAFFFYNNTTGATLNNQVVELASSPTRMLSVIQIAFFGIIIAILVAMHEINTNKKNQIESTNKSGQTDNTFYESEDFFND